MNEELIGSTEAICPYCFQMLKKFPGRKTKCPHCSEYMYIRTRPSDLLKVVVTKEQAKKIEWQWIRRDFKNRHPDFSWGWAVQKLTEEALNGNWGIYRNTLFQMAEFLEVEEDFTFALEIALYVAYLDLNGPVNLSGREGKRFVKSERLIAEGIVWFIAKNMVRLEIQLSDLSEEIIKEFADTPQQPSYPVSFLSAWKRLLPKLEKTIKQVNSWRKEVAINWQ